MTDNVELLVEQDNKYVLKEHLEPLPATHVKLMKLIERALNLGFLQELAVTPKGIRMKRWVTEEAEVFPDRPSAEDERSVDLSFLLEGKLELHNLPFVEWRHPYHSLLEAWQLLESKNLVPSHIVVRNEEHALAWLGLSELKGTLFGLRYTFVDSEMLEDRVIVLGTARPGMSLGDARVGVTIDTVVE